MNEKVLQGPVQVALPFIAQIRGKRLASRDAAVFEKWEKEASLDSHLAKPEVIDTLQKSNLRSYLKRAKVDYSQNSNLDLASFSKEELQASVREAAKQSATMLSEKFRLQRLETYLWLLERNKVVRQTLCLLFSKATIKVVLLSFGRYALLSEDHVLSLYKAYKAKKALLCEFRASMGDLFVMEEIDKYQRALSALKANHIKMLDIVIAYPYPRRLLSFKENGWMD